MSFLREKFYLFLLPAIFLLLASCAKDYEGLPGNQIYLDKDCLEGNIINAPKWVCVLPVSRSKYVAVGFASGQYPYKNATLNAKYNLGFLLIDVIADKLKKLNIATDIGDKSINKNIILFVKNNYLTSLSETFKVEKVWEYKPSGRYYVLVSCDKRVMNNKLKKLIIEYYLSDPDLSKKYKEKNAKLYIDNIFGDD